MVRLPVPSGSCLQAPLVQQAGGVPPAANSPNSSTSSPQAAGGNGEGGLRSVPDALSLPLLPPHALPLLQRGVGLGRRHSALVASKAQSGWQLLLTGSMGQAWGAASLKRFLLLLLLLLAALRVWDSQAAPLRARLGRVANDGGIGDAAGGRQKSRGEARRGRGLCGGLWRASGGAGSGAAGQRNPGLRPRRTFPTSHRGP